ncbi:glycosyltransferase family 2 protein [Streptococcus plurextorum]|uniref:glycosyltransferase family 2 protein n=1 Tax=Streptococcus plurextorum TaxID=456876 RepID=UPI000420A1DB|nr:glycosyltransferase family 2 protein [Streptococcus plurextorum]
MKVNILMATYNGEAYLAEQIESIQKQSFTEWELLIRDDCSKDRTIEIITDFAQKDSRIKLINPGQAENYGVIKSFYTLVKHSTADYYFFSDQDDIWLPDKLALTLEEAKKHDQSQPLMVYTDLKVVDQNLNLITDSMIRSQSHHANTELRQELTENTVTGGTSLINHALAQRWTVTEGLLMHDWYLALMASALGKLVYIDQATELYRQHDNNVLGARTWSKLIKMLIPPTSLVTKYWRLILTSQNQAKFLLRETLKPEDRDLLESFVTILQVPILERISRLRKYRLAKNRWFHTLVFTSLIITKFGYRSK